MDAGNGREAKGRTWTALAACVAAAALTVSCTVYRIKEIDGKALAAKPPKGKIISVTTAGERTDFAHKDPAQVKDGAIVGNVHAKLSLDTSEIADVIPAGKQVRVVCKDGDRFLVLSSLRVEDKVLCDVAYPKHIPIEDVVSVKVQSVNTAASILSTLGGAVLLVGALALDSELYGDDEEIDPGDTISGSLVSAMVDSWTDPSPGVRVKPRRSAGNLTALNRKGNTAGGTEFWVMEWTPVSAAPGEDGKYRVPIVNAAGVPRGVDEAKLVVVDHPAGLGVAPDVQERIRCFSALVPPQSATEGDGLDIISLVLDKDDVFWRSRGGDSGADTAARPRDEISLEFPRPKGARRAKLVVNATNSAWPVQFAREAEASPSGGARNGEAKPAYQEWEYSKLRVGLLTAFGWQTGQVIFAGGPLPAVDMIYDIDLDDVAADKVCLKLTPPAGYWLIDRVALDFSEDVAVEAEALDAEGADGPDAAAVLRALAVEDGSTVLLESPESMAVLTFPARPLKEGMGRTVFLRTVSCYEMPPRAGATPPRRPGPPAR